MQVGAGAGNAVKSVTGMIMPGNRKEEKAARKSGDHQDNKAAKDLDAEMKADPERMKKAVSQPSSASHCTQPIRKASKTQSGPDVSLGAGREYKGRSRAHEEGDEPTSQPLSAYA